MVRPLYPPSAQVPAALLPIVQTHLADVLWFLGLDLEAEGNKAEPRKRYTALIQLLLKKKLMGEELLLSRLENDVLADVGLVKDAVEFHKKQVKMNTRCAHSATPRQSVRAPAAPPPASRWPARRARRTVRSFAQATVHAAKV